MSEINQTDVNNTKTTFEDRESQYPNRRVIKIVSQTPNEIVADIERDEGAVSVDGTKINAAQFQSIENKLDTLQAQVTEQQGTVVKFANVPQSEVNFDSDPQTQLSNLANNTTKIKNGFGGFAAGQNAVTEQGVAVGNGASTNSGVALGGNASAGNGAAVGVAAVTGDGFAGGNQAKTINTNGAPIDAIQLGTGTNTKEKTLQVYGNNIYNAQNGTLSAHSLYLNGSFSALTDIGTGFSISDPVNVGIELGRRDGQTGTPYIDFHTDGKAGTDFNSRILAENNALYITAQGGVKINYNDGTYQDVMSIKKLENGEKGGCLKLQNNFAIQWGQCFHDKGQTEEISFPEAFTTLYSVVATWVNPSSSDTKEWNIRTYSNTGIKVRQNSTHSKTNGIFWIAIGLI